ncbi:MAG: adenylosuccinate synthetase, partial [Desulfobulbaceae bacterium]|nr:adenylosuccinate synthetase [Desulfobulbaceae bacterium]
DVLSGQNALKTATSYELDGKSYDAMPGNIKTTSKLNPVYEEMPGWQEEITQARSADDLPVKARNYVKRIEELTETPVMLLSVGPGREETMLLRNPFEK